MSSLISAELVATCNSLGYFDVHQNQYHADENTLESVKDLIRYLKRDDESHEIRRQLGDTKVLQTDLLPLLKNYWERTDLFDVVLRLLVNLTTPALMLWNEEIPTDRTARNQYLQIEEHLRMYKQAFADEAAWAILSTRISKILELDSDERSDENGLIIERILILIRNVLYVAGDAEDEKRPDNDASVHDQVLWALHQSGMLDIILYVSSASEKTYYMHILEIMSYMLREQHAKQLAAAALQRSQAEKQRDDAELLAMRHRESSMKQQKSRVYTGSRHSRFGGTFVVSSMKSISDNELIYHKPLSKLDELNFDHDKKKVKTPKNRVALKSSEASRRSAFSIRLFLKEFCVEFLDGAYNNFMYTVKERITRNQAQKNDDTYYLWALRFFLEFNRCYKCDIKLVSETMSVQAFQYVLRQLEQYMEMIVSDKKCVQLWSKRQHTALLAYRELLLTLCTMDKSSDSNVRDSSRVIKSNIFYILEYREIIIHILVNYNEVYMSPEYLRDVLETQHVFLKLLQAYCSGGQIMVQEKAKTKKPSKAKRSQAAAHAISPPIDLDELWNKVSDPLLDHIIADVTIREEIKWKAEEIFQEKLLEGAPANGASLDSLGVQKLIKQDEIELAIALMLEARVAFPDRIATPDHPAEQLSEFQTAFFSKVDLGLISKATEQNVEEDDDDYADEEDDLASSYQVHESDLKFEDFSHRLANPRVVRACALALKHFDRNTLQTNHCIVKLLHRIAFDSKMPTMLFQVSIFRTFQKIYAAKTLPQNSELVKFATYIIRQFFHVAATNSHVYMEALFWKNAKDAFDIEQGYDRYKERSKADTLAWSERQEEELRQLFIEHQADAIAEDIVDWIVSKLNGTRSRRAILRKLKQMYLLTDYKKPSLVMVARQWSDNEVEQLRELYEQFKDAMDPITCIINQLDGRRTKRRIIEKLLELGLVRDRKELRKKTAKKHKSNNDSFAYVGDDIERDSDLDSATDSEGDNANGSDDNSDNRSVLIKNSKSSNITKPRNMQAMDMRKLKAKKSGQSKKNENKGGKTSKAANKEVIRMLISITSTDAKLGLDWLKECFEDIQEDLASGIDDSAEAIPLVPILDYSISAMENGAFLDLLRAMGIQEPLVGQESYWRIPPSMDASVLQGFIDLLRQALDNTLSVEKDSAPDILMNQGDLGSEDEHVPQKSNKNDYNSEQQNATSKKGGNPKTEKMRALIKEIAGKKTTSSLDISIEETSFVSQNESNMNANQKNVENFAKERNKGLTKQRTRIRIESSSDDDENEAMESQRIGNQDESTRLSFRPSRIYDYDEDPVINTGLPSESTGEMFKSARIIDSDDEEEGGIQKESTNNENTVNTVENELEGYEVNYEKKRNSENFKRLRSPANSENENSQPKRVRALGSDDDE